MSRRIGLSTIVARSLRQHALSTAITVLSVAQTGVVLDAWKLEAVHLWTPAAMIALGAIAGVVPAVRRTTRMWRPISVRCLDSADLIVLVPHKSTHRLVRS